MEWLSYLRVPEGQKDKDWYKKIFDSLVPNTPLDSDRQKRLLGIYGILNNDIEIIKAELDAFCRPGGELFDPFDKDEKILSYNRIFPKFQYHLGQMLSYGSNFSIMRLGDEGNKLWNVELRDYVRKSIDERIMLRMEQIDMKNQGANDDEIEAYYQEMRSYEEPDAIDVANFMSSTERFYSRVLQYFINKFDLPALKKKSFRHVLASDFTCVGIVQDPAERPIPYVFNPLYVFHGKSADEEYISKAPYWGYHMPVTIAQAYDELINVISKKELEEFLSTFGISTESARRGDFRIDPQIHHDFSKQQQLYDSQSSIHAESVGQHMDDQTDIGRGRSIIWKTYLQFKAYRRVLFITTINEYGRSVTEAVPDSFEIPPDATKRKIKSRHNAMMTTRYEWIDPFGNPAYAEYIDIPRRYEAVKYGNKLVVMNRECPNQPLSIDDPMNFELSVKGKYFTSVNASPISIVERALNTYLQYLFVKHLMNRELRKYEGIVKSIDASMIPDYINQREDGTPIFDGMDKLSVWRYYRRKLGDSYFDSSQRTAGLAPHGSPGKPVSVETADSIAQIINMQNLLDLLDREMSIQMLVPPNAEGNFQPYSNATDNQMAIKTGSIIAESYYAEHNEIIRQMINEYLLQFRNYYIRFFEENPDVEETFLSYVLPNTGKEVIRITPDLLTHEDIGVFLKESLYSRQYREFISGRLQDIAQNQGQGVEILSELVMSLARGDAPEEIHYKIQGVTRKQQERMQEMQQMQQQIEEQAKLRQLQEEEQKSQMDHARKIDFMNQEYDRKQELAAIGVWLGNADSEGSNDHDDIPGYIEALDKVRKMNREDRKQALEERKFEHQKEMDSKLQKKESDARK